MSSAAGQPERRRRALSNGRDHPRAVLPQPTHGYPRPQLRRASWTSLNGAWQVALDNDARWSTPEQVAWGGSIVVPFAPETPASSIGDTGFHRACWYRRTVERPPLGTGERLILHFGAVDYAATVWVNGIVAARHEGGYTPFQADITELLVPDAPQAIVVHARDDPDDLAKPRGKQDWLLEPHLIWYPRTTGIWQTVWLERVPASALGALRWTSSLDRWEIGLEAAIVGVERDDLRLRVHLHIGDRTLADDTYGVISGEVTRRIALPDPGVDDYRNDLFWRPACPTLIEADLRLCDARGEVLDSVRSYTALRSVGIEDDRFILNGRPYALRLVLDQGYWPESGLTPPHDAALRRDVELAKEMGFNGVRKHQKIEDPRYLYWADTLGLLVWEEMPSAYRFTKTSIGRVMREWSAAIDRDYSHPCIVVRVPFNESSGVPDLPSKTGQRHYVEAMYHLTKTLDPDRPVIGNDGWESSATDIVGVHDYDHDVARIERRYGTEEAIPHLFRRGGPGGRRLILEGYEHTDQPIMLTEFGGIGLSSSPGGTWAYERANTAGELAEQYAQLLQVIRSLSLLAGFCYTQFADTYQEVNGLLYGDRTPKWPLEEIARATRGQRAEQDVLIEREALERLHALQGGHGESGSATAERLDHEPHGACSVPFGDGLTATSEQASQ